MRMPNPVHTGPVLLCRALFCASPRDLHSFSIHVPSIAHESSMAGMGYGCTAAGCFPGKPTSVRYVPNPVFCKRGTMMANCMEKKDPDSGC